MFATIVTRLGLALCLWGLVASMLPCSCGLANGRDLQSIRIAPSESGTARASETTCIRCAASRTGFWPQRVRRNPSQDRMPAPLGHVTSTVAEKGILYCLPAPNPGNAVPPDIFEMQILRQ